METSLQAVALAAAEAMLGYLIVPLDGSKAEEKRVASHTQ